MREISKRSPLLLAAILLVPLSFPAEELHLATAPQAAVLPASSAEVALRSLLQEQVGAWNRGDVEGFMHGYWRSPRLTFVGSGGAQRGWDAVLARYKKSYPDRAAMGRLAFSDLEITPLGPDAALILGCWQLQREKDAPGGVFTLVARRLPEGWRIIHDHTSAFESAPKQ